MNMLIAAEMAQVKFYADFMLGSVTLVEKGALVQAGSAH